MATFLSTPRRNFRGRKIAAMNYWCTHSSDHPISALSAHFNTDFAVHTDEPGAISAARTEFTLAAKTTKSTHAIDQPRSND
jgi:hypothetical protein